MSRSWGIVGTGGIAASFAAAITAEGDRVAAVASASADRARAFADDHGVPRSYGRRDELYGDPEVEVVYVATTNDRHHLDAGAAIAAGLPVLVEKPFALDVARARPVVDAARAAGVFAAEAMWMRVQPAFLELQRRIERGDIGTPALVQATFGFAADGDVTRRWLSRELGGGALLDVGIYPVTLAHAVLGPPTAVTASATLADTGVDAQAVGTFTHAEGGHSVWSCSLIADTGIEATIAGSEGLLRLHTPFHSAPRVSLHRRSEVVDDIAVGEHELGLRHEVREVQRRLDAGATSSDYLDLDQTLSVLGTLDEIRRQVGVIYADDTESASNGGA